MSFLRGCGNNMICNNLVVHAVPSYKEHLYKERLVNSLEYKEQRLVSIQIVKEHDCQVTYTQSPLIRNGSIRND